MTTTTIYVITSGDYSDYSIHGCFSSVEKCKQFMRNKWKDDVEMYERWISENKAELAKPREQRKIVPLWKPGPDGRETFEGYGPADDDYYHKQLASEINHLNECKYKLERDIWDSEYRVEEYILDRPADETKYADLNNEKK